MFKVKICGITNVEDAEVVAEAGADAVGLNFYPESPRFIERDVARQIIAHLPEGIVKVGLFVNSPPGEICATFDELGLDAVQLHGHEPPDLLARLGNRPIIRAFSVGEHELHKMTDYLLACRRMGTVPRVALADAHVPGVYGGSGTLADWKELEGYPSEEWHPPLVLAGGLTPQNVEDAIKVVSPAGVDTASGVEVSPGRKDHVKVKAFVRAALIAFGEEL